MSETQREYKALTWRAYLAIVFLIVIVLPSMTYYYLVTGQGLMLSSWIVILVWMELARMTGRPLTKQEIFIMLAFETMVIAGNFDLRWAFIIPVKNFYFATSSVVEAFGFVGKIPSWWAPPYSLMTEIYGSRTFLHPAWILPLGILILSAFFGMIANIALGFFTYQLYVSVEKLTFPAQAAAADTIVTLTEPQSSKFRVLLVSMFIGILYNVFSVFVPYVLNPPAQSSGLFIPVRGALDLTSALEGVLPGASFSISADLTPYIQGMLLPTSITSLQLLGSFLFYFVGNYIVTRFNFWPAEFQWSPGLGSYQVIAKSQLYFWNSVLIGLSIAVAFMPMLLHPKKLISAFSSMSKISTGTRANQLWLLLALFAGASIGSVLLVHVLVPEFPLWILILFIMGWSFLATFVSAMASGVTYATLQIPYLREVTIFYSGYRGFDIWLAPMNVYTGGASICGALLQADIVRCKHSEYIKAYIVIATLSLLMSFITVSYLWMVSPIPSGAYPYTITNWPIEALDWWRWQTWLWSGYIFRTELILGALAIGSVAVVVADLLKVPYAIVGVLTGPYIVSPSPVGPLAWTLAMFIGSMVGERVVSRVLSKYNWLNIRNQFVIGFLVGDSLMYTLLAVSTLGVKSMWLLPY